MRRPTTRRRLIRPPSMLRTGSTRPCSWSPRVPNPATGAARGHRRPGIRQTRRVFLAALASAGLLMTFAALSESPPILQVRPVSRRSLRPNPPSVAAEIRRTLLPAQGTSMPTVRRRFAATRRHLDRIGWQAGLTGSHRWRLWPPRLPAARFRPDPAMSAGFRRRQSQRTVCQSPKSPIRPAQDLVSAPPAARPARKSAFRAQRDAAVSAR